jgi:NAD+ diphosphatase
MRTAESVTFASSGLDRAAHLRSDDAALAACLADPSARLLPVWRGKPLISAQGAGWLATGHGVLADAVGGPVFLGLDDAGARFALDVSAWEPPTESMPLPTEFFDPSEQYHPAAPAGHRFAELRGVMTTLTRRDAELVVTAKALLAWHRNHRFCANCGLASEVVAGGWQRLCPSCKATHFPRTDPVVIMLVTRGNSVLLGRSPGWPERMYSLLAGFMEPGETVEAAVRREVFEETGVRIGAVSYLASQPWPYPGSLMLGCAGEALSEAITLDVKEVEAARWVSREELAKVFAGEHAEIQAPRKGAIAGFLLSGWLADRID